MYICILVFFIALALSIYHKQLSIGEDRKFEIPPNAFFLWQRHHQVYFAPASQQRYTAISVYIALRSTAIYVYNTCISASWWWRVLFCLSLNRALVEP